MKLPTNKLYYKISEVSDWLGESTETIKYWVREFNIKLTKGSSGRNQYTQEHLQLLRNIQHLLREGHLTIEGAKKALIHHPDEVTRRAEALAQLHSIRQELQEIYIHLDQIHRYATASDTRDRLRREDAL